MKPERQRRPWFVRSLHDMIGDVHTRTRVASGQWVRWVRSVPEPFDTPLGRVRGAWWVLTGRAFPVVWPKAGELEDALSGQATTEAIATAIRAGKE